MSEAAIQTALQNELLTLTSTFSAGDVTINDTHLLDGPTDNAPYAVIETADNFELTQINEQWQDVWEIPFVLIVFFTDSDDAFNAITTLRDTVIAHLRDPENLLDASIALKWGLQSIRADGPVEAKYDAGKLEAAEAQGLEPPLPTYLTQRLVITVLEIKVG